MDKLKLSKAEVDFLIDRLQKGDSIPEDFKYKLFPTKQKEYELAYGGKMRKEDILANEDGVFPVPLQVEKVFNGEREAFEDGWRNMIVFGDNLQFLKTIYENKDPLIKDKVKGKVKLIYIDPPFATEKDFKGIQGQDAYGDKARRSEFVEFIRRRLVLARELLAPDGSIFVHLDQKMSHYVKVLMDEIFGSNKYQNQVIWQSTASHNDAKRKYGNIHQVLFWYYKTTQPKYNFDDVRDEISAANLKEYSKLELADGSVIPYKGNERKKGKRFRTVDATWKGTTKEKQFTWRGCRPKSYREWWYDYQGMEDALERGELYLSNPEKGAIRCGKRYLEDNKGQILQDIWANVGRMSGGTGTYPTEKPEVLLERIIKSVTDPGDLVLDFFGGSGTTGVVAEKLQRKWITCDIGKLSFYTQQKRVLNIEKSKGVEGSKKKYGLKAKSFVTVNTGYYDLEKVFALGNNQYVDFVLELFEIEATKKKIKGVVINGQRKDGFYALIWPYWDFRDASVDENYLEDLHTHIGNKVGSRLYIIAPANYVDFISDYWEIGSVRYYFLKVPYQIIKELHKVEFKKFRQPQSKRNVNDLEDAIGFHFMRQPQVKSTLVSDDGIVELKITQFYSDFTEESTGNEMENFESLSMVLIDKDYNGSGFELDTHFFAEDLLKKAKGKNDENFEEIREELKQQNEIIIELPKTECGERLMVVYVDIYGNEFKEELEV